MYDFLLWGLQTPEVLELSKQIKEKLKEADQYGNVYNSLSRNLVLERERYSKCYYWMLNILGLLGIRIFFKRFLNVDIASSTFCQADPMLIIRII